MFLCVLIFSTPSHAASNTLVISQLQTGGSLSGTAGQEFVEVYNNSPDAFTFADLKLIYTTYNESSQKVFGVLPAGSIAPYGYALIATKGYIAANPQQKYDAISEYSGLNADGGHVLLQVSLTIGAEADEADRLGWGGALGAEGSSMALPAAAIKPAGGKSISRLIGSDLRYVDTDNNKADYSATESLPRAGGYVVLAEQDEDAPGASNPVDNTELVTASPCTRVIISEISANPAGSDTAVKTEFIELHNPTQIPIDISGCSLRTSANSKKYTFSESTLIGADEYRSFSYLETGLTLINGGGDVTLISPSEDTIYTYPALGDDQAWAYIDGVWKLTDLATPDLVNQLVEYAEEARVVTCPAGKFLNPDSGRCKTSAVAVVMSCDVGEVRNPETNRCRKIAATAIALSPCQAGYERNLTTNRCRKVANDTADLKPCDPGSERNPATNRCRKTSSAAILSGSKNMNEENVSEGTASGSFAWWALGVVGAGAAAYGVYEWRYELSKAGRRAFKALPFTGSGK